MSNPLTEARQTTDRFHGALRCVLPRPRPALDTIPPAARLAPRRRPVESTDRMRPGE